MTKVLIVIPPFLRVDVANLGAHVLQACGRFAGHEVSIYYANIRMAGMIGEELFQAICFSSERWMIGDRIFARTAYDVTPLGKNSERELINYEENIPSASGSLINLNYELIKQIEKEVDDFLIQLFDENTVYDVIGCTSMFNQTAASIAILNLAKKLFPQTTTIIGGANCAGEMANGIATLSKDVDFVFSGESEESFVTFLNAIQNDGIVDSDLVIEENNIIRGVPCNQLDSIPDLDYSDYFTQIETVNNHVLKTSIHIPFESSRGCWWGEKKQCTFCSVHEMAYRAKSSRRVLDQLKSITKKYPGHPVSFFDDIMPYEYFKELLPELKKEIPELKFFIDQKANLSLEKVKLLGEAGAYAILPGIESLSTSLLKRMDKGSTARQNIALMRYGRACQVYLVWFFLYGFPEDTYEEYEEQRRIIPFLSHLNPPRFIQEVELMRHSVFLNDPKRFNLSNLKPWKSYNAVLPEEVESESIAYYYDGELSSFIVDNQSFLTSVKQRVEEWRNLWVSGEKSPPLLTITELGEGQYLLTDSRPGIESDHELIIDEQKAAAALVQRSQKRIEENWEADWAITHKVALVIDGYFVPLATASPELLEWFEQQYKYPANSVQLPQKQYLP